MMECAEWSASVLAATSTWRDVWRSRAETFAFLGNSLLRPMTTETSIGLHESFWDAFSQQLGSAFRCHDRAALGVDRLKRYARGASSCRDAAVERVDVEYARLFIGPPKPAAPPWETMYAVRGRVGEAGFGDAAFEMRALLRDAGLAVRGPSNQYPDHLGLELLYLAAACGDMATGQRPAGDGRRLARFASEHPASWATALREAVESAAPEGYYLGIVEVAEGACCAFAEGVGV